MTHVLRHGQAGCCEHRRLVHVVPESADASRCKAAVKLAPPPAGRLTAEVREHGRPRPHLADIVGPVRRLHKMIASKARVIGRVPLPRRLGDMQIGDQDEVQPLLQQPLAQSRQVRERLAIHCEGPVAVLIVDVEIDDVRGDLVPAQPIRDPLHLSCGHVAVARLLESEGPQRRKGRGPRQPGIGLHHVLRGRAGEDVVVDAPAVRGDSDLVGRGAPEVEAGPKTIVQEEAVAATGAVDRQEEGDRLVERIGVRPEAEGVGVPECESAAAAINRTRLVPETEDVRVGVEALLQAEAFALKAGRGRGVVEHGSAGRVLHRQPQGFGIEDHVHRCGLEMIPRCVVGDLRAGLGGQRVGPDGVRVLARKIAADPDADHVISKCDYLNGHAVPLRRQGDRRGRRARRSHQAEDDGGQTGRDPHLA